MNYKWELSPPYCFRTPSLLHSHDLITAAARYRDAGGNRWLLSNRLLSGIRPESLLIWWKALSVDAGYSKNGLDDWCLLLFSPNVCVMKDQKLEVRMTWNVSFAWTCNAIWIPSSCALPTCSIVWLFCITHDYRWSPRIHVILRLPKPFHNLHSKPLCDIMI